MPPRPCVAADAAAACVLGVRATVTVVTARPVEPMALALALASVVASEGVDSTTAVGAASVAWVRVNVV